MEVAALPARELLQVDVQLRLKDADQHAAGADSATHIREEIVGVAEVEDDALALEVRPQPTPVAGHGGLTGFGLLVRPLRLRPGGRGEMTGRAGASQRGNGQRPRPLADRVHDPAPGMTREPVSTGNWAKYCGGLDRSGGRNTGGAAPASSHTIDRKI